MWIQSMKSWRLGREHLTFIYWPNLGRTKITYSTLSLKDMNPGQVKETLIYTENYKKELFCPRGQAKI